MSWRLVSAVFESALPAWLKPYAAACASFAADDGSRIFPSVARVARMVTRTPRATQKALAELRRRGILEIEHAAVRYAPTRYRLNLAALPQITDGTQLPLFAHKFSTGFSTGDVQNSSAFQSFPQASTGRGELGFTPGVNWASPDPSVDPSRTIHRTRAREEKGKRQKTG